MKLFAVVSFVILIVGCGGGGKDTPANLEDASDGTSGRTTGSIILSGDIDTQLDTGYVGVSLASPNYIVIVDQSSSVILTSPDELTPYIADLNNGFAIVVIDLGSGTKGISMSVAIDGAKLDYLCTTPVTTTDEFECGVNSVYLDIDNRTVTFDSAKVVNISTEAILTVDGTLVWNAIVDNSSGPVAEGSGASVAGNGIATELEGKWTYTCEYNDIYDPDFATYDTNSITFLGNTYSTSSIEYSDPACTIIDGTYSSTGTFAIGNSVTTSSGKSAKEIDFDIFYDIFRIEDDRLYIGDQGDYIGDDWEYSGSTDENRPIDLDFSLFYRKE